MKHKLPLSLSVIAQQNILKDSQFIITSASEETSPEHSVLGEQIKNEAIIVLHCMALQVQDSSLALIFSPHRSYRHTLAALLETENCASTERDFKSAEEEDRIRKYFHHCITNSLVSRDLLLLLPIDREYSNDYRTLHR